MNFKIGQGILVKIPYKDGVGTPKNRSYLIVDIDYGKCKIKILNVSTVQGKETKLVRYRTNIKLIKYNPPFIRESFVKIDSSQEVDFGQAEKFRILCDGKVLAKDELGEILSKLEQYELEQAYIDLGIHF